MALAYALSKSPASYSSRPALHQCSPTNIAGKPSRDHCELEFTNHYRPVSWLGFEGDLAMTDARFLGFDGDQADLYFQLLRSAAPPWVRSLVTSLETS